MLTLLSEIHFWSGQEDICIKDTDYGAFRYYERKDNGQSPHYTSKKNYAEQRDYLWNLTNKRPTKLKDKLKELEDQIDQNKIVYCQWANNNILQLMLNTGMITNICVNMYTGDVQKISFDKYLVGKLQSECISDVLITRRHLLCTYNDNQISVVYFAKILNQNIPEKLNKLEPKIQVVELAGPSGRKLERKMSCNLSKDKLLVWWRCTRDEVYPWSPLVKDQDRANIHIYNLSGLKLELICYRRTEFDPVGINFSTKHQNIIHCVEQKVSRKGAVTVETCTFEIIKNKLQQLLVTTIPLQTQVSCHAFSPDNEKLLLGCIDGSVVLFDQGRGVTHLVKAAFIPTTVSWHLDGAVILVANEKCQIQCFDISLACIKSQILSEDITPSSVLDLVSYFRNQPTLLQMIWNKKPEMSHFYGRYLQTDGLLLLLFEHGPLTVLRLFSSTGIRGDMHMAGLTADVLVNQYVLINQIDRAIGVLLSLNWDMYGASCLMSLHRITNHLFKQRLTPEGEGQIQKALGSFYAPLQPISDTVYMEFGEQVKDLTRKFFHLLVRYALFEKAFCLAIDVNDYDLFMDLYYCALVISDEAMATAALNRAKDLINRSNSSNSNHSACSRSSCSQCFASDDNQSDNENWEPQYPQDVPPLPIPNKPLPYLPIPVSTYAPPLPNISNKTSPNLQLQSRQPMINIPPFPTVRKMYNQPQTGNPPLKYYASTANTQKYSTLQLSATSSNLTKPIIRNADANSILKPKISNYGATGPLNAFKTIDTSLKLKAPATEKNNLLGIHAASNQFGPPKLFQSRLAHSSSTLTPFVSQQSTSFSTGSGPREIVHKTISMNIPPPPSLINVVAQINPPPTIKNPIPLKINAPPQSSSTNTATKNSGEKNVKFSDTVTAFIVPEIARNEKKTQVKENFRRPSNHYLTNPKQELADSLPLCHPNDDYLKDFTPISNNSEDEDKGTKIKVVHFGMV